MRVFFTNLGCKLNQSELEAMAREFHLAGHRVVGDVAEADLHVINSCTVTHKAARDSRKVARRSGRRSPALRTVLTGCYATEAPAEAAALAGVDLVVANDRKDDVLELVHQAFPESVPDPALRLEEPIPVPFVPLEFGHTRASIKVEDGCNMRCAFCIIPFTRGRQRSRSIPEVLAEARGLEQAGFGEIVVTGVQISSYRWEGQRLYDLVAALLEGTSQVRLRLTSIAPWQFDRRLLELWRDDRLCRHIHMSLQSGCDDTLVRMRRPYSTAVYADLVAELRQAIPGLALTTDVIVGFPGETDEDFEASLAFSQQMAFAKTHVFSYSPRAGTLSATFDGEVDPPVLRSRARRLIDTCAESEEAFQKAHVGSEVEVLWEFERDGTWIGMTDNYLKVAIPARPPSGAGSLGGPRLDLAHQRTRNLVRAVENGALLVDAIPAPKPSLLSVLY